MWKNAAITPAISQFQLWEMAKNKYEHCTSHMFVFIVRNFTKLNRNFYCRPFAPIPNELFPPRADLVIHVFQKKEKIWPPKMVLWLSNDDGPSV